MDYPKHNRHSIRLQGYDYAQPGVYFITIVAHDRKCLFGEIVNGDMRINECGEMAQQCWLEIPNHFPQTQLDEYIIMPDHIHGIIIINDFPIVAPTIRTIPPIVPIIAPTIRIIAPTIRTVTQ